MLNFEKPPLHGESREKEQTPEEILEILNEALKSEAPVDLVILNQNGEPELVPHLFVEEIEGIDYVMLSYFDEKGNLGEVIPLELSRVKKAELKV